LANHFLKHGRPFEGHHLTAASSVFAKLQHGTQNCDAGKVKMQAEIESTCRCILAYLVRFHSLKTKSVRPYGFCFYSSREDKALYIQESQQLLNAGKQDLEVAL
jgi:hypothetical protein